nr:diguanylate cyclase [Pseudomonas qingdaonensis]
MAGDKAPRQIANAIRHCCSRLDNLPARSGGDAFALGRPSTSPEGARLVAEKLRQSIIVLKSPTPRIMQARIYTPALVWQYILQSSAADAASW